MSGGRRATATARARRNRGAAPIDWARLNHILLPQGKAERDALRSSRLGRSVAPISGILDALTEEGRLVSLVTLVVAATALDSGTPTPTSSSASSRLSSAHRSRRAPSCTWAT